MLRLATWVKKNSKIINLKRGGERGGEGRAGEGSEAG